MSQQEIDDVIGTHSGRPRAVLEYSQFMKRMVNAAKQSGFTAEAWQGLERLVDTEKFQRIGNFKEVMDWHQYTEFLTAWAASSEWDCSFKRITEHGNVVFLELEERSKTGPHESVVNSLSVYEFDDSGKIHHIDVYLQMSLPDPAMLQSYQGIEITA